MEEDPEAIKMKGSLLLICKSWGYRGATREVFYKNIKGLNYHYMKEILLSLEESGFVTLEWVDPDRFNAYITQEGETYLEKWLTDLRLS